MAVFCLSHILHDFANSLLHWTKCLRNRRKREEGKSLTHSRAHRKEVFFLWNERVDFIQFKTYRAHASHIYVITITIIEFEPHKVARFVESGSIFVGDFAVERSSSRSLGNNDGQVRIYRLARLLTYTKQRANDQVEKNEPITGEALDKGRLIGRRSKR